MSITVEPQSVGRRRSRAIFSTGALSVAVMVASILAPVAPEPAVANPLAFDPGLIISDSQFYDANAMTEAEIQSFLEQKIGPCTTTRCLDIFRFSMPTYPEFRSVTTGNLVCRQVDGGTNLLASTVIFRVQQACGISAKVILVTLDKEQGLITGRQSTGPSDYALNFAMGWNCPDTTGCIDASSALGHQIYRGGRQLVTYKLANFGTYKPGVQNILFAPSPSCGSSPVNIRNFATAALYNYTPYQPSAASLAAYPRATGNACDSYGNRNFYRYYYAWFGNPVAVTPNGVSVSRIGGANRYDVAAEISRVSFAAGVPVAFVASGEVFPDALSAAPAAARSSGPVLLVERGSVPPAIRAELVRLQPQRIVVVGGPGSVSDAVYAELARLTPRIERIGGANRFDVSTTLARAEFGASGASQLFIATGGVFADALSAAPAAAAAGAPMILVDSAETVIRAELDRLISDLRVTKVSIAGGPASVSPALESNLVARLGRENVVRYTGADRFAVSVSVNSTAFPTASRVYVASGLTFPDALAGAAVAGPARAPLFVVPTECLPRGVVDYIVSSGATSMTILGGPASVAPAVEGFRNC